MSRKPQKQNKLRTALRKVLERVLLAVLVLVCIGAFYLAVILAEVPADQGAPEATFVPPAALVPEQPRQIGALADIGQLTEKFPAPMLAFSANSSLLFDGGLVNDLAYQGSFARLVTLTYHTQAGETLTLQSIYPADAFSLLPGKGYALKDTLTAALAGMTAVRMENADTIRLHVRGESALYSFTAPRMGEEALNELSRQAVLVMP